MQPPEPGVERLIVELLAEVLYRARSPASAQAVPWAWASAQGHQYWRHLAQAALRRGYRIVDNADGGRRAIQCLRCGLTSHSAGDVERRYCGACKVFFEEGT